MEAVEMILELIVWFFFDWTQGSSEKDEIIHFLKCSCNQSEAMKEQTGYKNGFLMLLSISLAKT